MRRAAVEKIAEKIFRPESPPAPAQLDLFALQSRQPRFVVKMDPVFGYLVWDNLRQKPVARRRGRIRYFKKFDPANRRAEALNNAKGGL